MPTCTEGPQTPPPQPHHPPKGVGAAELGGWAWVSTARQHGRCFAGTGISTRHPSTTPVGLALGSHSPRADYAWPLEPFGHSALGLLTLVSLLMPAFSLPHRPPAVTHRLPPVQDAPLPPTTPATTRTRRTMKGTTSWVRGFGGVLEPRYIVGARSLDQ